MSPEQNGVINALTVDFEDWYHGLTRTNPHPEQWDYMPARIEASASLLLDLLAEARVHATFFILGDVAHRHPKIVRRVAEMGHELASHGFSHRPVHHLTPDEFRRDLDDTRQLIADITGVGVVGFRAPYFSIDQRNLWAFGILEQAGYQYDSSIFPLKTILYGYSGASRIPYRPQSGEGLVEYPISTLRLLGRNFPVSGGFYNRMLPYRIIRWSLRKLNQRGIAAILYLHPWELDLHQPRIPVSPRERITHFGGRASLAGKLYRLSRDFHLAPLGEVHNLWVTAHPIRSIGGFS
jgi:polysaccharide deacetylase family protein (PEP-CTERM system associated)